MDKDTTRRELALIVPILDFRFFGSCPVQAWAKEIQSSARGLALSVSAVSGREAMPQALRSAIVNSIIQN